MLVHELQHRRECDCSRIAYDYPNMVMHFIADGEGVPEAARREHRVSLPDGLVTLSLCTYMRGR